MPDRHKGMPGRPHKGPAPSPGKRPAIFISRPEIKIRRLDTKNTSGSLFNPDNVHHDLFSTYSRPAPGSYLHIRVVNHNLTLPRQKGQEVLTDQGSGSKAEPDLEEDRLLRSLPHLAPASASHKAEAIPKELKMRVIHQYSNGDLLLHWERESISPEEARTQHLQVRLPYEKLSPSSELTTNDLTDIVLIEHYKGEILEKKSTAWQDEYTLRISGFDEAKSKAAAEIESKRQELSAIKNKVKKRLKTLGSERRQWAREKENWLKKHQEDQMQMKKTRKQQEERNGLIEQQKAKIQEQAALIETQQSKIKELSWPEGMPNDGE